MNAGADPGVALNLLLIGMGVTFGAIMLLWGVMALLVRFTAERVTPESAPPPPEDVGDRRRRAAVAAVAVALAREQVARRALPPSAEAAISPWQAARRGARPDQQRRERR
ncbi:MAG: OadG family protein [Chloroflexi bacterium]|nr:OadG family protein [Chloroflexota bacterium]